MKLKPCPFCGSINLYVNKAYSISGNAYDFSSIECEDCMAQMSDFIDFKVDMRKTWVNQQKDKRKKAKALDAKVRRKWEKREMK